MGPFSKSKVSRAQYGASYSGRVVAQRDNRDTFGVVAGLLEGGVPA